MRFLVSPVKRERRRGASRSLTILLRFCLMMGRATGPGTDAVGRGGGTTVGRGEGAALGRGEGAALDGLEVTVEPLAVFVLILSLGAGRGTGDDMVGVDTDFGILTDAIAGFD